MPDRNNDQWIVDLRSRGPKQEAALADLRAVLQAGLPYALNAWLSPDDPRYAPLVEEVLQETLIRVLSSLDSFEGRSQFTTWVHTIAVRIALTELRRAKWRDVSLDARMETESGEYSPVEGVDTAPLPETEAEQSDILIRVRHIIMEELSAKQRQAMVAVGIYKMPIEEVARRMGMNRNALYKLMHDGRLRLKRRLAREGLAVEEIVSIFEHG